MPASLFNVRFYVFIFFGYLHPLFFSLPLFSQRFSCIIGPNGSGKSNVIDSMLFVFGYRAQKIRSKKLSVLIHSSDKHKDVESCTVEVHFQKIIDKVYLCVYFHAQSHTTLTTKLQCLIWGCVELFIDFPFEKCFSSIFYYLFICCSWP